MKTGYLKFNTDEQREQKLNLFEAVELDKVYATNGNSFEEFLTTVVSDGDTIYISTLADFGTEPQSWIRAFRYFEEHPDVKLVILEGLVNEPLLYLNKSRATRIVKIFSAMLASGQIS